MTEDDANQNHSASTLRERAEEQSRAGEAKTQEMLSPEAARQALHELRAHQIELEIQNEELRRTQAELEALRDRYFDLYDLAPVGYFTLSEKEVILEANLTAAGLLGVARSALVKQRLTRFILPEDQDIYYRHRKQLFETGAPQVCEFRMLRADAAPFWARMEAIAVQDADGAPLCRAVMSDTTERKRSEEALLESERKYRSLVQNVPAKIFMKDAQSTYLSCNENYARDLGISPDQIGGTTDYDFYPTELARKYQTDDMRIMASGNIETLEERYIQDGQETWVNTLKTPIRDEQGNVVGLLGIFWDITKRRQAEQKLRVSETRYRRLFESAKDGILILDPVTGQIVDANPFIEDLLGYSPGELIGKALWDIGSFKDIATPKDVFDKLQRNEYIRYDNLPLERIDGSHIAVEFTSNVYLVEDNRVIQCNVRDISERKRREDERARLVMAIEHAAEAVVVTDTQGTIEYVNPAFEQITGYTREEAVGKNPRILNSGKQDRAFYAHLWDTIARGDVWSGRFTNMKKDGRLYEEESTISPVFDAGGAIVSYVAIKRDISERLALEHRLRRAQKMEAIGTLASGIAHDFNNVLAAIIGYGQMAASELAPDSQVRKDLEHILCAADRAEDLVHQILTFSRQVEEERRPVGLGLVVEEALKLLRPSLPATIEIRTRIEKDCGLVLADATQVHQVIVNLCTNAYHAMRKTGGILTVSVEPFQAEAPLIQSHPGLHEGPYVRLSVSDTGCGMAKETLERVFDPFFTTKAQGEGTGLGLATVHGIVSAHGGAVTVYSDMGKGTIFHVYFPRAELAAPEAPLSEEPVRGGHERILVLDDEEPLANLMARALRQLGYGVVAMTSSVDALAAFRAHPQLFDLVVTDQTMPQMTGEQLAVEVRRIRPDVPVILTTGLTGDTLQERLGDSGVSAVLMKPAHVLETARIVRQVLDGSWRNVVSCNHAEISISTESIKSSHDEQGQIGNNAQSLPN
jgi:PAS domain S-box-containing protein